MSNKTVQIAITCLETVNDVDYLWCLSMANV